MEKSINKHQEHRSLAERFANWRQSLNEHWIDKKGEKLNSVFMIPEGAHFAIKDETFKSYADPNCPNLNVYKEALDFSTDIPKADPIEHDPTRPFAIAALSATVVGKKETSISVIGDPNVNGVARKARLPLHILDYAIIVEK